MIDLDYLKTIGIRNYLLENEKITNTKQNISTFLMDCERNPISKTEEQREDIRLYNVIKHTAIYRRITTELKNNEDTKEIPNPSAEHQSNRDFLNPRFYRTTTPKTEYPTLRGAALSDITIAQREHERKEKIRRTIEKTLRKFNIQKRINNRLYREYLLYLLENFDIMDSNELENELTAIHTTFKPSRLTKSWEANEQKKDNGIPICNRKKD